MRTTWRALASTAVTAVVVGLLWLVLAVPLAPLGVAGWLLHDRRDDTDLLIAAVLGVVGAGLLVLMGPRLARALAAVERWRLRLPDDPLAPPGDPAAWRPVTYVLLLAVVAPVWLAVLGLCAVLILSTPLAVYDRIASGNAIGDVAGRLALGLVLIPVQLWLASAFASRHAAVARALLCGDSDTEAGPAAARLVEVTRSRARMADAFDAERMRIERDLHDVAQQRLVSLTMQLGLAKHDLAQLDLPADSPAADALDSALEQGKTLMAELRDLVRGISPQTLRELGLRAAVEELAAGSPLRITVDVVSGRYPPGVETVAFAAVSEALANTAKHAPATGRAAVTASRAGDLLTVEVRDDGPGGADPSRGSGLTGLADRAAAAGGRLLMSSPAGGPTILRVELPCAS
ncbi:histidine kinase [Actinoplanes sp. NPDC051411]|uniref:sensor histidine kinase n=1 Tax=Actinoplanes sp. NPDC051411 TaxID=3155522 RepID=UPI003434240E